MVNYTIHITCFLIRKSTFNNILYLGISQSPLPNSFPLFNYIIKLNSISIKAL